MPPAKDATLDGAAGAFGVASVVTIIFNVVLAWIKDAYDPLNSYMASLTGHHWITHGLADLAVFFVVGFALMLTGATYNGRKLIIAVIAATLAGGAGLTLWFVVV